MYELRGDIFACADRLAGTRSVKIVIPVNIGWKRDGRNVMGRGLAAQALKRDPTVDIVWGKHCRGHAHSAPVLAYQQWIFFPTKPLGSKEPHLSWQNPASPRLICLSCEQLNCTRWYNTAILVPMCGAGNGGLPDRLVEEILTYYLIDDRYCLVKL